MAISIEVDRTVAFRVSHSGPPVGESDVEVSLSVIDVNQLRIGPVVADDDIQVTIAVDVHEPSRVRSVRGRAEVVRCRKVAYTISEKDTIDERPMAAFRKEVSR